MGLAQHPPRRLRRLSPTRARRTSDGPHALRVVRQWLRSRLPDCRDQWADGHHHSCREKDQLQQPEGELSADRIQRPRWPLGGREDGHDEPDQQVPANSSVEGVVHDENQNHRDGTKGRSAAALTPQVRALISRPSGIGLKTSVARASQAMSRPRIHPRTMARRMSITLRAMNLYP